jgi:hypothetical protein
MAAASFQERSMRHLSLSWLAAWLLASPVQAQNADSAAYAKLPVCRLAADGRHLAVEPCRTAPTNRKLPRRPVPQLITPMPRMAAPQPSVVWGPVLTAPGRASLPALGAPALPAGTPALPGPSAPIPVTCDAGGCRDSNGSYYPGSGTLVSPSGRMCSNNGVWMQCQ